MLTTCYQHKRNCGRPYLHNKDVIVCNLWLIFTKISEVVIDSHGLVKDWFKEALHK
jgi:hypothetical protein